MLVPNTKCEFGKEDTGLDCLHRAKWEAEQARAMLAMKKPSDTTGRIIAYAHMTICQSYKAFAREYFRVFPHHMTNDIQTLMQSIEDDLSV